MYNWGFDTGLDQIIIELLAKSHQRPQVMTKTTYQSRVEYGQPLQVTNISSCYDVIVKHTISTSYTYYIHVPPFSWTGYIGSVRE